MVKITLFGEICTDIFIYGNIERLCPEAPVPVFKPIKTTMNKGMVGNVAENIKSINKNLEVIVHCQKKVLTKTRYVHEKSNQMIIRIDEGENDNIDILEIDNKIFNDIKTSDLVIVSDYDKGFLDLETLNIIGKNSKISILDSKKKLTDEIVKNFTFLKLNESEYHNNLHLSNFSNVLITLGSKGVMFNNKIFPTNTPKETIDVSGAGDTFVASFALKFFQTNNVYESIQYANENASIVVSKRGVSTP